MDVEIEDSETVEALGVIIYSMRPEVGEELRVLHKGRILKADAVLADCGMQSGDSIAIAAKKAAAKPTSDECAGDGSATTTKENVNPQFVPPVRRDDVELTTEEPPAKAASPRSTQDTTEEPPAKAAKTEAPEQVSTPPTAPQESTMPREVSPTVDLPAQAFAPASPTEGDLAAPGTPSSQSAYPKVDTTTAAGLLAFAELLKGGTAAPPPEHLEALMRASAARMEVLEGTAKELAQALQVVNMFSAEALRKNIDILNGDAPLQQSPSNKEEEGGRSFMIKKGDTELQDAYRKASEESKAALVKQTGGVCSDTPKTKEEMDKARQARLARLESQQAEKQKQKDEADEKYRAREAMFTRRDEGKSKPLSKP